MKPGAIQYGVLSDECWLSGEGHPEIRRIRTQTVSEKAWRCDAGDRVGQLIDSERPTNHAGIKTEVLLPGTVADYCHWRRVGPVVLIRDRAARKGVHSERRK